jgi:predicted helicase
VVPKRVELAGGWRHVLVTDLPIEHVAVSLKTIDYLLPLYLYPDPTQKPITSQLESGGRIANLNPKFLKALKAAYGRDLAPEAIFCYVYAVLHAETYREKYAEFLKRTETIGD